MFSVISVLMAIGMMFDSAFRILLDDNSGFSGIMHLLMNVYAM